MMITENHQVEPAGIQRCQMLPTAFECGDDMSNLQCSLKSKMTDIEARLASEIAAQQRKNVELQAIEQRYLKTETALKTLEERNRVLGDSAPFGIFVVDSQGKNCRDQSENDGNGSLVYSPKGNSIRNFK